MPAAHETPFPAGSGEIAAQMREHDWSACPIGSPEQWPASLRTVVDLMLGSRIPMFVAWGEDLTFLYNDAYIEVLGAKHPASLGARFQDVWAEIWPDISPLVEAALEGRATYSENLPLLMNRKGFDEQTWFTFSYSPARDETGRVKGMYCACFETTGQILADRNKSEAEERLTLALSAGRGIGTWDWDVPADRVYADERFAQLYGVDRDKAKAGAPIGEFFAKIHPDDLAEAQARIEAALASGETFNAEYRLVQPGGDVRWVAAEGRCVMGADGAPMRFPGVTFDINDRKAQEARQQALLELSDAIRDLTDPAEIAQASSEVLAKVLGVSRVGYGVMDTVAETVTIERDYNAPGIQSIAGVIQFRDFGSYIENLARGEAVIFADAGKDSRISDGGAALDTISARALINLPLIEQGKVVALLFVNNATPRGWSDEDVALVREVAERVRSASERARATAELRTNEARLRFLNALASETQRLRDADEMLAVTTRMTAEYLGVTNCAYADMDADQDGFTIRGDWAAPGSPSIVGHYSLADFGKLAVQELGAGRSLIVNDNLKELAPEEAKTFQDIGISATICMPLVRDGRLAALMAIHDKAPRQWTELELATIREVTERSWAHVERVRSEVELRESEERYRTLFETMDEGFCVIESIDGPEGPMSDYVHVEANPAYAEQAGIAKVVGQTLRETLGDEAQAWIETYGEVLRTGRPIRFERELQATGRWLELLAFRVEPESRRQVAMLFQDVTDRKRADALRAAQNAMLEAAVKEAPLGEVLEALLRTVEAHSSTGMLGSILLADDDGVHLRHGAAPSLPDAYNAAVDGISIREGEGSCGTAAHRKEPVYVTDLVHDPLWVDFRDLALEYGLRACWSTPILSAGGELLGTFAMYYREPREPLPADLELVGFVTRSASLVIERHRAGEALRELNATLEERVAARTAERDRLWSNTQDVQVVIDGDGRFEDVNPAFTEVLGWTPADVIGRTVFDFVVEDDTEVTNAALVHARNDVLPVIENRYRHKEGGLRWLSWVATPAAGVIYASGRHITAEKEQAALLKAAEEALRQSQKMEAVGQLTGGIAHDFNNLLAGISGSLELLGKRLSEGRLNGMERYIDAAQGSAQRAASLTQRLLAFSRRQTLDPKPTDVNRLINGMEDLIRRSVGPDVEVEVVGAGGLWATRIDPSQLENALLNLCINARDAMAPDGGRLTIETSNKWLDDRASRDRELPSGQYVSLCVTDTGTGMTPEVQAQVFDPFFTTKPLGQGTGLGLSMIHGFVRQSGGQVRIYSEVGKGTTMCLYLPRYMGEAEDGDDLPDHSVVEDGHGETVLVIDDEETVRMLVAEVLGDAGYQVIEAPDGPSGLEILRSDRRIDLLITDVGLPGGMNGRQVADAAREGRPDLKVLFITGYAENAAVGNGLLAPGMEVITKPFAMAAMGLKVREMIEG